LDHWTKLVPRGVGEFKGRTTIYNEGLDLSSLNYFCPCVGSVLIPKI